MAYKTVIFDLDGTLLNTLDDLADSVNAVLSQHGFALRSIEETRASVGNGIAKLIEASVPPTCSDTEKQQVLEEFKRYYAEHCAVKTAPYPGVLDMLKHLHEAGIVCAISSNKGDFAVQSLVKDYFGELIDIAYGEREGIPRKPAPDSIFAMMDELGATSETSVYVGDSEVDLVTAKNCGLACISCSWGFRERAVLEANGATTIVDSVEELEAALL